MDEFSQNYNNGQVEYLDGEQLVKTIRRKRKVRKGRKRQNAFRALLCFVMNIVLIFGIIYIAKMPQWYMPQSAFKALDGNSVEIINNRIVPSYRIFAALRASDVPNVPIYMAKTDKIKDAIMKLAPVEDVYIRRYAFPARIQIILREREPYIMISPDEKVKPVAFFTKDGKLIGHEYLPLKKDYKTILVLSYGNKGDDYRKWDLQKLNRIAKIAKYVETYSKEPVEYFDLRDPNNAFVKIKTVNIRLGRIDESVYERIKRIPSILPQVKLVDAKVKYLDLSWEKVNYLKLGN